jgi:hypothetical protein
MNFEKRHEKIRTELNSLSKKIIRLRAENRFLKKLFLLEKEKSKPEKKVRKKPGSKYKDQIMRNLDRFYVD